MPAFFVLFKEIRILKATLCVKVYSKTPALQFYRSGAFSEM
jgi:hypothetical protein